ncbi:MAG TPA: NUDIX hydrolase [Candidatus Saccharimonadales bacterium]|nr:NUDIX hydrolase [Candidatus Saccharimonadales bacterium]
MKKLIPNDAVLVPDQAERAFRGMIFDVYQWPQKLFDGSEHRFEMLKRTDTVTAVCVVDNKVLVVHDEQPHLGLRQSFPGGRVDADDTSIETAARREILEETGYRFNQWRLVQVRQPYRKIEWFVYVWLAWDVAGQQEPHLDPGEKISAKLLSFDEVKAQVLQDDGASAQSYLGESRDIFGRVNSVDDLLALPEFEGREVDR